MTCGRFFIAIAALAFLGPFAAAADEPTLSDRYPGDEGIGEDAAVLFFDDFEAGWGRWDAPHRDTETLFLEIDPQRAHSGSAFLRSSVTRAQLEAAGTIGSATAVRFERRVDRLFVRFYARFPEVSPAPHHWVRVEAGDDRYAGSGLANTVPNGDEGFWFNLDADDAGLFAFYVYWHRMRSGRCNDGSAIPGCAGDQGSTYFFGNRFRPRNQRPFPRDQWICIELRAEANDPGHSNGSLALWIDERLVGDYAPQTVTGTWLRGAFHEGGCEFRACGPPQPFAGFDFRTDLRVGFKRIFLSAYYQVDTTRRRSEELARGGLDVGRVQTVLYDDVVAATTRIGCRRSP